LRTNALKHSHEGFEMNIKTIVSARCAIASAAGAAIAAFAETGSKCRHPPRAGVNPPGDQNRRVGVERCARRISLARYLHSEDHGIRVRQRIDARGDRRQLNRDENPVSRQIGR
jgi:hypothetical protein